MHIITLETFIETAFDDKRAGIFHTGGRLFELRCTAGIVVFEARQTAMHLPALLTILATKGIYRLPLEWDCW